MAKAITQGAAVCDDVSLCENAGRSGFLLERMRHHLKFTLARHWEGATQHNKYISLALAVRDVAACRMMRTHGTYAEQKARRVYYLSLEYLLGRLLRNNLVNLGLYEDCRASLASIGENLGQILEIEPDAGLGNGGLGRLAACYIDSAATLEYPVYGYGIRYEHGIFEQRIENGWQIENPEYWLTYGTPWEFVRPEFATVIRLRGRVEHGTDATGRYRARWVDFNTVAGVPYDIPIVGYANNTVNILRLWSSRASSAFDLQKFNLGGFLEAVQDKMLSETISKVLYPADETERGRHLRLVQQYFFVACTLADIIRRHEREHDTLDNLPDKVAIQLNDTHPSLAIAELMRILVDERDMPWEQAWEMTRAIFAYTNHTLMPEALEVWPVYMFERYLPRHLEIIYEINQRFLQTVEARWPGDDGHKRRMSLIQEDTPRSVRMAHLAIVGSHAVNGVAEMHSDLVRTDLVPDFAALWPERFTNVTNGITPRRWLQACNPELAAAITRRIGTDWLYDFERIRELAAHADDPEFQEEFRQVKRANKQRLGHLVLRNMGVTVKNDALFDMQMKRLHEYKRQLLSILHVVMLYHELLDTPGSRVPRVVFYAAKAAPSYYRAKLVIKLIHDVASTINRDQRINEHLRVVFIPNYRVSLAEEMIPAADLSEQISTAGTEASGTGNMKFAMNGALTIGTLDGANVEIRKAVGEENFFLFGLTADEVAAARPRHDPGQIYRSHEAVRRALDAIADGRFNPAEPSLHRQVHDWLIREGDHYLLMADIASYADAQCRVETLWKDQAAWTRAAILNVANIGFFSSDRSVKEYAERIWNVEHIPVGNDTTL
ncbi:MAG: glycogen/starch/alpha-glucan phosphorylase [Phycisphaerales bacterium]|nr:glycogen/starch/alpha-glucan phosphorylase [Phycisphaerales bacterium]